MNIYITGINYRTAPLPIRENLSFNIEEQQAALLQIARLSPVDECVLLSTCNRTELYLYSETQNLDYNVIENELCRLKNLPVLEYRKYFYFYQGVNAVKHLFRVASGMDSQVPGEDQVLGQVKIAHRTALGAGTSKTYLNTLFREAVTSAKSLKHHLNLARVPRSVAALAVKTVQQRLPGELSGRTLLIIGSGEIGGLVSASWAHSGVRKIIMASRNRRGSAAKPEALPPVTHIDYHARYDFMDDADIIFSATASPHYTITRDRLEKNLTTPKKRIFVDLAVPRDIDADIRELPGVIYLNIDDLAQNVETDWELRLLANIKAEQIINEHLLSFERWYQFRNMLPLMREIQHAFDGYVSDKINDTLAKLQTTHNKDKELVRKAMLSLANYFLNKHVYAIKENASGDEAGIYFKCLGRTFVQPDGPAGETPSRQDVGSAE